MATKKAPAAAKKEKRPFTGNKEIDAISIDTIIAYCEENNKMDWFDWATAQPSKRVKKNGEACDISFYELRAMFVKEFMPELKKPAAPKKPTWRDKAAAAVAAAKKAGK